MSADGLDTGVLGVAVLAGDADTLVVDKPAGMPAEMRDDPRGRSLLERARRAGWPQARLPHRLDAGTDGIQVVARDADAVERHNAALREDRWAKRYVATVDAGGDPATLLGTHRRYLRRRGRVAEVVRSGGRPAWQDHELVAAAPDDDALWVVVVRLRTGRYHQVRAVLADLGHPLVGDERYRAVAAGRAPGRPGDGERPWLTHARCDGIELDGTPTVIRLPSSPQGRGRWPHEVVAHLLRDDLDTGP